LTFGFRFFLATFSPSIRGIPSAVISPCNGISKFELSGFERMAFFAAAERLLGFAGAGIGGVEGSSGGGDEGITGALALALDFGAGFAVGMTSRANIGGRSFGCGASDGCAVSFTGSKSIRCDV
jgi:hypothetical protein